MMTMVTVFAASDLLVLLVSSLAPLVVNSVADVGVGVVEAGETEESKESMMKEVV
jgi:type III secretory pathway component EscS